VRQQTAPRGDETGRQFDLRQDFIKKFAALWSHSKPTLEMRATRRELER
jgi:hypothetical protein